MKSHIARMKKVQCVIFVQDKDVYLTRLFEIAGTRPYIANVAVILR